MMCSGLPNRAYVTIKTNIIIIATLEALVISSSLSLEMPCCSYRNCKALIRKRSSTYSTSHGKQSTQGQVMFVSASNPMTFLIGAAFDDEEIYSITWDILCFVGVVLIRDFPRFKKCLTYLLPQCETVQLYTVLRVPTVIN